jgi:drug/metabolite transporter (DMT)-like permease
MHRARVPLYSMAKWSLYHTSAKPLPPPVFSMPFSKVKKSPVGSMSAVFATAFAFAAWQRGISRIGANRVLVYQYLITLTGVVSGIILFGERLGAGKILGGAIILLGVYLARR